MGRSGWVRGFQAPVGWAPSATRKHTYRKGREVIDEKDAGEDRGAVVVRVGVPLKPRRPFPVQGLEALRHREAVRADGLACGWLGLVFGWSWGFCGWTRRGSLCIVLGR